MSWFRDPVLLLALSIVFCVDQITKALVRHNLLLYQSVPVEGPVRITHTFNTGSAFGLFPDQTLFLILASFVGIGVLLLIYRNHPFPTLLLRLSLGMQLGGAVGNLLDRLRMGLVTDFIDIGVWPVFNVADASIVTGLVIIAYVFLVSRRPDARSSIPALEGEPRFWLDGQGWVSVHGPMPELPCPVCESEMVAVPGGRRCPECGVNERIDRGQVGGP